MEQVKVYKPLSMEEIKEDILQRKTKLKRIPELTEEEQDILDAIKMGLEDIKEGRVYTIEEAKRGLYLVKIVLAKSFILDFQYIKMYISRDSYDIAEKFVSKIMDYIYTLSIFPKLGTLILEQYNIRKLIYHNYIIIYQLDYNSNLITIIKILNSKQDINIILKHIKKYI